MAAFLPLAQNVLQTRLFLVEIGAQRAKPVRRNRLARAKCDDACLLFSVIYNNALLKLVVKHL